MNNQDAFPEDLQAYFPKIFDPVKGVSPALAGIMDPDRSVQDVAADLVGDFGMSATMAEEMVEQLRHNHSVIPALFDKAYMHVYSELPNRRFFDETTTEELKRVNDGSSKGATVILMDVDKLHAVNERYGYATGDEFLKTAALHIRDQIRNHEGIDDNNVIAHFGGDEFAVLITNETDDVGQNVAKVLRESLEGLSYTAPDQAAIPIRMSAGIIHAAAGDDFSALMGRADAALAANKSERAPLRDRLEADLSPQN